MKQNRIDLHIEKLVLNGFRTGDGERIRAAVQQELSRLLAARGISESPALDASCTRLKGGQIKIEPEMSAAAAGRQIALAIYGATKR